MHFIIERLLVPPFEGMDGGKRDGELNAQSKQLVVRGLLREIMNPEIKGGQ